MAITNRKTLVAEIQAECFGRTDQQFVAAIPRFIMQAEQRIAYGGRAPWPSTPIRCKAMEAVETLAVMDGEGALPTGFLEFRRITWLEDIVGTPEYVSPEAFYATRSKAVTGVPTVYTIEANKLLVSPKVSGSFTVTYWKKLPALVAENDTNELLTEAPEIYLFAAVYAAQMWERDYTAAKETFGQFLSVAEAFAGMNVQARHSGNRLAPRLRA